MEGVIFFGGDRDKTRALETKLEDTAVVYLKEIEKLKKQITASKVTEMESYRTALHFHLKLWIHENNLELSDYSEDLVDDQKLFKEYRDQIYRTGMEDLNELDNYEPFFQYYKVKFQCFFFKQRDEYQEVFERALRNMENANETLQQTLDWFRHKNIIKGLLSDDDVTGALEEYLPKRSKNFFKEWLSGSAMDDPSEFAGYAYQLFNMKDAYNQFLYLFIPTILEESPEIEEWMENPRDWFQKAIIEGLKKKKGERKEAKEEEKKAKERA